MMDSRSGTGRVDAPVRRAPSVALYSHDAMGVGHVRRNLLIAQALSRPPLQATSLLICGVHEASAFTGGHGIDCLTLPSFEKHANDDYRPRELRMSAESVTDIRAATLQSALLTMRPDLLIVDKVPMGLNGELKTVLPPLRELGTRVVFGMRDVLDARDLVAKEWQRHGYDRYICENYDQVWVYGDREIFDPAVEYNFSAGLRNLIKYTGYLDQRDRVRFAAQLELQTVAEFGDLSDTVLCMLGGGEDGHQLAQAFVQAPLPPGKRGLLITGPLMSSAAFHEFKRVAQSRADLEVVRYVKDADLLVAKVAAVICMGGYNSMLSVVSFGKPALIVPRVKPRQEQLIRGQLFEQRGLLDCLTPDQLSTSALSAWMQKAVEPSIADAFRAPGIDLGGLGRICHHAFQLCSQNRNGFSQSHLNSVRVLDNA